MNGANGESHEHEPGTAADHNSSESIALRTMKRKFAMVEQDRNFQSFATFTRQAICPFQVFDEKYIFTILCLGTPIPDLPGYNTAKYIYPVGYKGLRSFPSLESPESLGSYSFEIGYGGLHGPVFVVHFVAKDEAFVGETPERAWQPVLRRLREKGMECPDWINGHALFGLTSKEVQKQIGRLPGARAASASVISNSSALQSILSARSVISELQQAERVLQIPLQQHIMALAASTGQAGDSVERAAAARVATAKQIQKVIMAHQKETLLTVQHVKAKLEEQLSGRRPVSVGQAEQEEEDGEEEEEVVQAEEGAAVEAHQSEEAAHTSAEKGQEEPRAGSLGRGRGRGRWRVGLEDREQSARRAERQKEEEKLRREAERFEGVMRTRCVTWEDLDLVMLCDPSLESSWDEQARIPIPLAKDAAAELALPEELVATVLEVWEFVRAFSDSLLVHPLPLAEFCAALQDPHCAAFHALHVALLQQLVVQPEPGSLLVPPPLNALTWPELLRQYLVEMYRRLYRAGKEVVAEKMEIQRWCQHLASPCYNSLPFKVRLELLELHMQLALDSPQLRRQLEMRVESEHALKRQRVHDVNLVIDTHRRDARRDHPESAPAPDSTDRPDVGRAAAGVDASVEVVEVVEIGAAPAEPEAQVARPSAASTLPQHSAHAAAPGTRVQVDSALPEETRAGINGAQVGHASAPVRVDSAMIVEDSQRVDGARLAVEAGGDGSQMQLDIARATVQSSSSTSGHAHVGAGLADHARLRSSAVATDNPLGAAGGMAVDLSRMGPVGMPTNPSRVGSGGMAADQTRVGTSGMAMEPTRMLAKVIDHARVGSSDQAQLGSSGMAVDHARALSSGIATDHARVGPGGMVVDHVRVGSGGMVDVARVGSGGMVEHARAGSGSMIGHAGVASAGLANHGPVGSVGMVDRGGSVGMVADNSRIGSGVMVDKARVGSASAGMAHPGPVGSVRMVDQALVGSGGLVADRARVGSGRMVEQARVGSGGMVADSDGVGSGGMMDHARVGSAVIVDHSRVESGGMVLDQARVASAGMSTDHSRIGMDSSQAREGAARGGEGSHLPRTGTDSAVVGTGAPGAPLDSFCRSIRMASHGAVDGSAVETGQTQESPRMGMDVPCGGSTVQQPQQHQQTLLSQHPILNQQQASLQAGTTVEEEVFRIRRQMMNAAEVLRQHKKPSWKDMRMDRLLELFNAAASACVRRELRGGAFSAASVRQSYLACVIECCLAAAATPVISVQQLQELAAIVEPEATIATTSPHPDVFSPSFALGNTDASGRRMLRREGEVSQEGPRSEAGGGKVDEQGKTGTEDGAFQSLEQLDGAAVEDEDEDEDEEPEHEHMGGHEEMVEEEEMEVSSASEAFSQKGQESGEDDGDDRAAVMADQAGPKAPVRAARQRGRARGTGAQSGRVRGGGAGTHRGRARVRGGRGGRGAPRGERTPRAQIQVGAKPKEEEEDSELEEEVVDRPEEEDDEDEDEDEEVLQDDAVVLADMTKRQGLHSLAGGGASAMNDADGVGNATGERVEKGLEWLKCCECGGWRYFSPSLDPGAVDPSQPWTCATARRQCRRFNDVENFMTEWTEFVQDDRITTMHQLSMDGKVFDVHEVFWSAQSLGGSESVLGRWKDLANDMMLRRTGYPCIATKGRNFGFLNKLYARWKLRDFESSREFMKIPRKYRKPHPMVVTLPGFGVAHKPRKPSTSAATDVDHEPEEDTMEVESCEAARAAAVEGGDQGLAMAEALGSPRVASSAQPHAQAAPPSTTAQPAQLLRGLDGSGAVQALLSGQLAWPATLRPPSVAPRHALPAYQQAALSATQFALLASPEPSMASEEAVQEEDAGAAEAGSAGEGEASSQPARGAERDSRGGRGRGGRPGRRKREGWGDVVEEAMQRLSEKEKQLVRMARCESMCKGMRKDEERARRAIEAKFARTSVVVDECRGVPLGSDRHFQRYWVLGGDFSKIWIENPRLDGKKRPRGWAEPRWGLLDSLEGLLWLGETLDARGARESALKSQLQLHADSFHAAMTAAQTSAADGAAAAEQGRAQQGSRESGWGKRHGDGDGGQRQRQRRRPLRYRIEEVRTRAEQRGDGEEVVVAEEGVSGELGRTLVKLKKDLLYMEKALGQVLQQDTSPEGFCAVREKWVATVQMAAQPRVLLQCAQGLATWVPTQRLARWIRVQPPVSNWFAHCAFYPQGSAKDAAVAEQVRVHAQAQGEGMGEAAAGQGQGEGGEEGGGERVAAWQHVLDCSPWMEVDAVSCAVVALYIHALDMALLYDARDSQPETTTSAAPPDHQPRPADGQPSAA